MIRSSNGRNIPTIKSIELRPSEPNSARFLCNPKTNNSDDQETSTVKKAKLYDSHHYQNMQHNFEAIAHTSKKDSGIDN
jgi:hypothetical protein